MKSFIRLFAGFKNKVCISLFISCLLVFSLPVFSFSASPETERANALYEKGEYVQAFRIYKAQAEQGDSYAQYSLGFMHAKGQGVKQDYWEALKWYQKAANQGYEDAKVALKRISK